MPSRRPRGLLWRQPARLWRRRVQSGHHQEFFDRNPASRMKIDVDAEDTRSSEGSGPATLQLRKGKGKTPERPWRPAERHPHDSDSFVTGSDGDGPSRRPRHEPTGCKVGVAGAVGGEGDNTPSSSGGEGPPPPYCSR